LAIPLILPQNLLQQMVQKEKIHSAGSIHLIVPQLIATKGDRDHHHRRRHNHGHSHSKRTVSGNKERCHDRVRRGVSSRNEDNPSSEVSNVQKCGDSDGALEVSSKQGIDQPQEDVNDNDDIARIFEEDEKSKNDEIDSEEIQEEILTATPSSRKQKRESISIANIDNISGMGSIDHNMSSSFDFFNGMSMGLEMINDGGDGHDYFDDENNKDENAIYYDSFALVLDDIRSEREKKKEAKKKKGSNSDDENSGNDDNDDKVLLNITQRDLMAHKHSHHRHHNHSTDSKRLLSRDGNARTRRHQHVLTNSSKMISDRRSPSNLCLGNSARPTRWNRNAWSSKNIKSSQNKNQSSTDDYVGTIKEEEEDVLECANNRNGNSLVGDKGSCSASAANSEAKRDISICISDISNEFRSKNNLKAKGCSSSFDFFNDMSSAMDIIKEDHDYFSEEFPRRGHDSIFHDSFALVLDEIRKERKEQKNENDKKLGSTTRSVVLSNKSKHRNYHRNDKSPTRSKSERSNRDRSRKNIADATRSSSEPSDRKHINYRQERFRRKTHTLTAEVARSK